MSTYQAPAQDTAFVLDQLVEFDKLCETMQLGEVNLELAKLIVEEAGKLASDVLAPLNAKGDQNGTKLVDAKVQESPGFAEAYQQPPLGICLHGLQAGVPSGSDPDRNALLVGRGLIAAVREFERAGHVAGAVPDLPHTV